jgi:asparagine synthase (glutamine-hydrolysing)
MCGIDGLIVRTGVVNEIDLKSMTEMMIHRGPDGGGTFVSGNVGLGHRRLRVIDLSENADQPLFNETSDVAIVYNGEIYNFAELRGQLKSMGHQFKTKSDTEVIVHAFEQWGTDSFRRFNGMFAFALWDGRGKTPAVYLVRDRFGIKPLFYAHKEERLAFASELKPLLRLPWIDSSVEPQTLFYFLKFSHVPQPLSIVNGIKQLPPGHWLKYEDGEVSGGTYYDLIEMSRTPKVETGGLDEWVSDFERTLIGVVERQMISDVPTGCFLSGGVDSSLLVMAHRELGGEPISTFTIGYKEEEFDESLYAREVAKHFKTRHHELITQASDYFDIIPDIPTYFDQPLGDPTVIPTLLLSKFARQHVTVALSGDGGDELFCGYTYQQALSVFSAALGLPLGVRRKLGLLTESIARNSSSLSLQRLGKLAEIFQFRDNAELLQYFIGTVGPMRLDRVANLVNGPVKLDPPLFSGMLETIKELPWEDQIEQVFLRTFLTDTVLAKTDRAGMAFGLEARVPFLDHDMLDFSSKLPFSFKLHHGSTKYLLRETLARKLPGKLARRPKQGFSIPLREWLRTDLKYLLDEYLGEHRLKREGLLNARAVGDLVKQHVAARANHSHLLWSLVNFQMWKERFLP